MSEPTECDQIGHDLVRERLSPRRTVEHVRCTRCSYRDSRVHLRPQEDRSPAIPRQQEG